MISIDRQKCNGCGICVDICPTGAITVQDNIAVVEYDLCEDCQVCMDACPQDAILRQEQISVVEKQPVSTIPASKVEVLPLKSENNRKAISKNRSLITAFGSAIIEVLPRLASLAVDWLEHRSYTENTSSQNDYTQSLGRTSTQQPTGNGQGQRKGQGNGRRRGQGQNRKQGKRRRRRNRR